MHSEHRVYHKDDSKYLSDVIECSFEKQETTQTRAWTSKNVKYKNVQIGACQLVTIPLSGGLRSRENFALHSSRGLW